MNQRFVPTARIDDVVLADAIPGPHFERLWHGAHPGHDGEPAFPVVVHDGPAGWNGLDADTRAQLGNEVAYVQNRLRLKALLDGRGLPRILRTVDAAGHTALGYVEEHAGDLSLAHLVRTNTSVEGQLPFGVCLAIIRRVALPHAALEAVSTGIRINATPDAIFVDDRGVVRSLIEPVPGWNQMATGTAVGVIRSTYAYFSPEEIMGRQLDHRASMFGLGMLLFELVAGRYPFADERRESPIVLLQALYQTRLPSLAAWRQDVPGPIAFLVERLTRRESRDRFPGWVEVLAAIDGAMERTERAGEAEIAAVCAALCPDEMALGRERREEIAVADLGLITIPEHPDRRLGALAVGAPPPAPVAVVDATSAWEGPTPAEIDAPFIGRDGQPMWRLVLDAATAIEDWPPLTLAEFEGGPPRPRVLLVDAAPVTHDAWARFCIETGRAPPSSWGAPVPPPELAATPVVNVGHDDAVAYASHYGKELPAESVWVAAVQGLGAARLQTGAVWEWTTTPRRGGHIVRGGRFRDRPGVASDGLSTSWEDEPAPDLGFRCVIREVDPTE